MENTGYENLCNAVVEQAVTDYRKMLRRCKTLNIYNPDEWLERHWHKVGNGERKNNSSLVSIIRYGIDARNFLLDETRLSLYTKIDGKRLVEQINSSL